MNKTLKIYVFFLTLIIGLVIFIDVSRPKPVNWRSSYIIKDKIPYGLFVFNNEFPKLINDQALTLIRDKSIYEFLTVEHEYITSHYLNEDTYEYEEVEEILDYENNELTQDDLLVKTKETIFYINNHYAIDETSNTTLMNYVKNGGYAFLSVEDFPKNLLDSVKLEIEFAYQGLDTLQLKFNHNKTTTPIVYGAHGKYFKFKKNFKGQSIGYYETKVVEDDVKHTFVKVPWGEGHFLLHLYPAMFTNINLLKDNNYKHAEQCLSFLPPTTVNWYVKDQAGIIISQNPLRFIKEHPSLKWSWYFGWILLFIFIIFTAKRKQRVVPIIPPVTNTTVDFTKTIGNLYFQEKNYHDLMTKKVLFFLEKTRSELLIDTSTLDEVFTNRYHHKSGKPLEDVQEAVKLINRTQKSNYATEEDLVALNKAINKIIC